LHTLRAETARARPALERALAIAQELGVPGLIPNTLAHVGHAYSLAGRHDEGRTLLEQGLERSEAIGSGYVRASSLRWFAEVCLAAGDEARARDAAEQALAHTRAH